MVGVPRSSGCSLCRKRRVKCDEQRPHCGNCVKYGAECPGFDRGLKFVSGKHQIRQRGPARGSRENTARPGSSLSSSTTSPLSDRTFTIEGGSSSSRGGGNNEGLNGYDQEILLTVAPSPNRAQFIGTLLGSIPDRASQADVVGLFSWMRLDKLGSKAALDGAMCSLAMHLVGKDVSDQAMIAHSRTLYGQSLQTLQASLRHRTEWDTPETLGSAMLLCIYELFAGTTSSDTWLQHARGIGVLMEQRGPAAHAKGWDAAMLLSFRSILIMSEMFWPTKKGCFLGRPEWKPMMRDNGRRLVHPDQLSKEKIRISDDFLQLLAEIPEILKWGYMMRMGIALDESRKSVVAESAIDTRNRLLLWFEGVEKLPWGPKEVLSEDPNPLYATVLHFDWSWAGSMHMGYWASMLILEDTLKQCGTPVAPEESQKNYVKSILRSVESVSKGIMGPYRVGFAIRIAYEVASAEAQEWVRRRLDTWNKKYAATDKSTYPNTREDDEGYS